jgi:hypothetical protein
MCIYIQAQKLENIHNSTVDSLMKGRLQLTHHKTYEFHFEELVLLLQCRNEATATI